MQKGKPKVRRQPRQAQRRQPGLEYVMRPRPQFLDTERRGNGKLAGKVALITGGDSGIGRAVACAYASEGADIAIVYLDEHRDAHETQRIVAYLGRRCLAIAGDVGDAAFCRRAVAAARHHLGRLDILVNNAAEQHFSATIHDVSVRQLERTFRTNLFAMFYLTQAILPHFRTGSAIINTTSVTAYRGSHKLIDYAASKGAIVTFTRSLAASLVDRGIRVNAVAPGPVWTPLIPASLPPAATATFGSEQPMGRAAQPFEIAPCYVFLASRDSTYMTGQVLHPNGGEIVNG